MLINAIRIAEEDGSRRIVRKFFHGGLKKTRIGRIIGFSNPEIVTLNFLKTFLPLRKNTTARVFGIFDKVNFNLRIIFFDFGKFILYNLDGIIG